MAKQRIYRQQLRTNDFVQPIHIGDTPVLFAAESGGVSEKFINIWFEDAYDRQDHLPPMRNFRVLTTGEIVPAFYSYVTTVVFKNGHVYHIYQESRDRD